MGIINAKLSQLRLSPLNQRHVKPSAIEAMADDIVAHGLLQNLVAYEEEGLFHVFAGGRRYRALKELVKRKRIKNSDAFPVEVCTKEEAIELSLAENFQREDMHPADSIRAFAALRDTGMDAEEIAARFGQAVSYVYKMLRLSALAPALIDLIAKDQLTLEAARALTLTDDHDQQLKACKAANGHAHTIRRMLTTEKVATTSGAFIFVGRDVAMAHQSNVDHLHLLYRSRPSVEHQFFGVSQGRVAKSRIPYVGFLFRCYSSPETRTFFLPPCAAAFLKSPSCFVYEFTRPSIYDNVLYHI